MNTETKKIRNNHTARHKAYMQVLILTDKITKISLSSDSIMAVNSLQLHAPTPSVQWDILRNLYSSDSHAFEKQYLGNLLI